MVPEGLRVNIQGSRRGAVLAGKPCMIDASAYVRKFFENRSLIIGSLY